MIPRRVNTVVVGAGKTGLAMSADMRDHQIDRVMLEHESIAASWRDARWDSLVMNGPTWHDRFSDRGFDSDPYGFPSKDEVARYFKDFARQLGAPIHCGVEFIDATALQDGWYQVETSKVTIRADHIVAATGPFQIPVILAIVPDGMVAQTHSSDYRTPKQL